MNRNEHGIKCTKSSRIASVAKSKAYLRLRIMPTIDYTSNSFNLITIPDTALNWSLAMARTIGVREIEIEFNRENIFWREKIVHKFMGHTMCFFTFSRCINNECN